MPATQTTPAAILAAFTLGFTTRKPGRGNSFEARAQRAGATQRKITADHDRAMTAWLSMEVFYANSAGACLAEKAASAVVLAC